MIIEIHALVYQKIAIVTCMGVIHSNICLFVI